MTCIWSDGVFTSSKADTTAVRAILTHKMAGKVCQLHQTQTYHGADAIVGALDEGIPASIRMLNTAAAMPIGKKTNENNPHRRDCFSEAKKVWCMYALCDVCDVCVVCLSQKRRNSATNRSFGEENIWAYCC